jgi:hypothetical protein
MKNWQRSNPINSYCLLMACHVERSETSLALIDVLLPPRADTKLILKLAARSSLLRRLLIKLPMNYNG